MSADLPAGVAAYERSSGLKRELDIAVGALYLDVLHIDNALVDLERAMVISERMGSPPSYRLPQRRVW